MQIRLLALIGSSLLQGVIAVNLHVQPAPSGDLELLSLHSASESSSGLEDQKNAQRKLALSDDVEITNDSEDTRGIIPINGLELTLRPTPVALETDQISLIVETMEIFLVDELQETNSSLSLISAIYFNEDVETEFTPASRMLRKGRYLAGGDTAAYSTMKISGGSANHTWSIDYGDDYPSPDEINEAILSILVKVMGDILNSLGLVNVTEVDVRPYLKPAILLAPEKIAPDDIDDEEGGGSRVAISATFGCLAAVIVGCVIAYQSRKGNTFKNMGNRYREVTSNLRMKSLKRQSSRNSDGEYLVEVCTDLTVDETPKLDLSQESSINQSFHTSVQSPSSVIGQKQKVEDKKTIDPSDYVVEIGTDEISY